MNQFIQKLAKKKDNRTDQTWPQYTVLPLVSHFGIVFAWPIMDKHDVIHKTGSTSHIALSSKNDRATVTANIYRKFREVWTFGF